MGASRRIRRSIMRPSQRKAQKVAEQLAVENMALRKQLMEARQRELAHAAAAEWMDDLELAGELAERGLEPGPIDIGEPGELSEDEQELVDAGVAAFKAARGIED